LAETHSLQHVNAGHTSAHFLDQELIPFCYLSFCSTCSCWGVRSSKKPKASIDRAGFLTWHYTFKMAAITSTCHPVACQARVISLSRCMDYSSWSILHSYLFQWGIHIQPSLRPTLFHRGKQHLNNETKLFVRSFFPLKLAALHCLSE